MSYLHNTKNHIKQLFENWNLNLNSTQNILGIFSYNFRKRVKYLHCETGHTSRTTIFLSFILYLCMVSMAFLAVSLSLNSIILQCISNQSMFIVIKIMLLQNNRDFIGRSIFTQIRWIKQIYPDPRDFPSGVSNISTYCTSPTVKKIQHVGSSKSKIYFKIFNNKDNCVVLN